MKRIFTEWKKYFPTVTNVEWICVLDVHHVWLTRTLIHPSLHCTNLKIHFYSSLHHFLSQYQNGRMWCVWRRMMLGEASSVINNAAALMLWHETDIRFWHLLDQHKIFTNFLNCCSRCALTRVCQIPLHCGFSVNFAEPIDLNWLEDFGNFPFQFSWFSNHDELEHGPIAAPSMRINNNNFQVTPSTLFWRIHNDAFTNSSSHVKSHVLYFYFYDYDIDSIFGAAGENCVWA